MIYRPAADHSYPVSTRCRRVPPVCGLPLRKAPKAKPIGAGLSYSLTINSHEFARFTGADAMIDEFKKMVIVAIAFGLFIVASQMAAGMPLYGVTTAVEIAAR